MTDDYMTGEELGLKLLESVRQMKRGEAARVTRVPVSEAVEARNMVGLSQRAFAALLWGYRRVLCKIGSKGGARLRGLLKRCFA